MVLFWIKFHFIFFEYTKMEKKRKVEVDKPVEGKKQKQENELISKSEVFETDNRTIKSKLKQDNYYLDHNRRDNLHLSS